MWPIVDYPEWIWDSFYDPEALQELTQVSPFVAKPAPKEYLPKAREERFGAHVRRPNTKEYRPSSSEECPKIERQHCPDSGELCPETNEEQYEEYVSCLEPDENASLPPSLADFSHEAHQLLWISCLRGSQYWNTSILLKYIFNKIKY